ncbi:MAG: 50S ribosomal protein L21 [Candidatus Dormibacteraeota bacterium]|jgi:large subunit ribosomal protein L21|nr:50S ribosomal protein L21 [Candidatus Dormibacteraeota bacterium]
MYAIVQIGGRQYRATPGQRVVVDRLDVEPGAELQLEDVRMVVAEAGDSGATMVGTPRLSEVTVNATAVSHLRGPKILVFKYKPKKRYRRQRGFRADLTELRIDSIASLEGGRAKPLEPKATGLKPEVPEAVAAAPIEAAVAEEKSETARPATARKRQPTKSAAPKPSEKVPNEEDGDGA